MGQYNSTQFTTFINNLDIPICVTLQDGSRYFVKESLSIYGSNATNIVSMGRSCSSHDNDLFITNANNNRVNRSLILPGTYYITSTNLLLNNNSNLILDTIVDEQVLNENIGDEIEEYDIVLLSKGIPAVKICDLDNLDESCTQIISNYSK